MLILSAVAGLSVGGFLTAPHHASFSGRHVQPVASLMTESKVAGATSRALGQAQEQNRRTPYKYFRDQGDAEDGLIDIELVETLIAQRAQYRADGEFEEADVVKGRLTELGVTVIDKERSWFIGKRPRRGARMGSAIASPMSEKPETNLMERFGPLGHDYIRADESGVEVDAEGLAHINELLRNRLEAKLCGDFAAADALLLELSQKGVSVDDTSKEWRADAPVGGWRRSPGDGDSALPVNPGRIMRLIADRDEAKRTRQFSTADYIRKQLRDKHSVIVDDKRRTWKVVRHYGGYYRAGPPVDKAMPRIAGLLRKYGSALRRGKEGEEEAAATQARLADLGVRMNHEYKTWTRPKRPRRSSLPAVAEASRSSA